jgi:hypothetical protein
MLKDLIKETHKLSKENKEKGNYRSWKRVVPQTKGNSRMQHTFHKGTHGNETI